MASVYRRRSRDGKPMPLWSYSYRDHTGKRRSGTGTRDKSVTRGIAEHLEAQERMVAAGLKEARDLSAEKAARRPVSEHIDDYRRFLVDKGNTAKHAGHSAGAIARLLEEAGCEKLPQIAQDALQATLRRWVDTKSRRTANHALGALRAFLGWCASTGRIREVPGWLRAIKPYNQQIDRKRIRRALTADELARLLEAAEGGDPLPYYGRTKSKHSVKYLTGRERAALYRLAAATGLRANELRTLTGECLKLSGDDPCVIVRAGYSKHRREGVQPLRREDAAWLRAWAEGREGLPLLIVPEKTAKMLRHDLAAAGIPHATPDGVVDFHALRATYISLLVRAGVDPKRVQVLARHSTITLTMDTYARVTNEDLRQALEKGGGREVTS